MFKMRPLNNIFLFILIFLSVAYGQEKIPIAILDLKPVDLPSSKAVAVSDLIRTELFNTGLFRVFERNEMDKVLQEQKSGLTGLTETENAVKIGRLLNAKKILVGTVSKLGDSFIVNARIIDVEKGEMEFAEKA